jgi:hypothetical protein
MQTLRGKCAQGHDIQVTIDDDGNARATIGTEGIDPAPDPDWDGENPIIVACKDCVEEVKRVTIP